MVNLINQIRALLVVILTAEMEMNSAQLNNILIRGIMKLIRGKRIDQTILTQDQLREYRELVKEYNNHYQEE